MTMNVASVRRLGTSSARVLLLALLCAAVIWLSLQETLVGTQSGTYRAGVDLAEIDVVVLDEARRPITGLTAADFLVRDGNRLRPPDAFVAVELPKAQTPALERFQLRSGVLSNARSQDGRLVVVVFDRSIRAGADTVAARAVGRSVIDALGATDMAAVVRSSGFATEGVNQNFTSETSRLRAAVEAPFLGFTQPSSAGADSGPQSGECPCGVCSLQTVERVADAMFSERRRQKVIFIVARDLVIQEGPAGGSCSVLIKDSRVRAFRSLSRSNVTVHVVDPSGLETLAARADGTPRRNASAELARQGNLGVLPSHTGGRLVANTNEPSHAVGAIFSETQSYYLLGVVPSEVAPGESRQIEVLVSRQGATAIARRSYFSLQGRPTAETESDPLLQLIRPLLPLNTMPLKLSATPSFLQSGAPVVSIALGVAPVAGSSPASLEPRSRRLDVIVGLFDDRARMVMSTRELEVVIPEERMSYGEWRSRFSAPPGRYELRIGVRDVDTREAGSIFGFVEVPAPRAQAIQMSGLRLRSRSVATEGQADSLLRRTFTQSDEVRAEVEIVRRDSGRGEVAIGARLTRLNGAEVFAWPRSIGQFNQANVADVSLPINVNGLAPGEYLLTLECVQDDETVVRDVAFEIERGQ